MPNPGRLVMVWEDASFIGFALNTPAPANYLDWKAQNQVFTDMTATRYTTASLTGTAAGAAFRRKVTPNFFDVLGVQRRWEDRSQRKRTEHKAQWFAQP